MKINKSYHGFKLVSIKNINDIKAELYEFVHEKSHATLVYLKNDDTNKCFSIGFRTVPTDSTGVCHIIEHSLLCGSKKYPVKEPFVNLLKGSMATFLNAMTASDFTVYPVASQNEKDFDNLVSVYLDAVFAPICMKDPKPFLQEGWHLEMNEATDTPSYKGIVYNEMQGAMSGVESQIGQLTDTLLYKGSCYEYNSGGDPDVIPELTYEQYKEFYYKHYHPSNGIIYLYGDLNLEEKLKFINDEYLSLFEGPTDFIEIKKPEPRIDTSYVGEYEITEDEEESGNTYMSLAFVLCDASNIRDVIGFSILNEALMSTNASPLKKALLDKELGEEIVAGVNDGALLTSYQFYIHKTNLDKKEEFIQAVFDECKKLVDEGIDKDLLLATINRNEFKTMEMDSGTMPKGLLFAFSFVQGFLYDIPYEGFLEYSKYYKFFKEELEKGYFENLLKKYVLNSNHYIAAALVPSKRLAARKQEALNKKMAQIKENMSEDEIQNCVTVTKELIEYQTRRDSKEDLDKLPTLKLSDISTKVKELPTLLNYENGYNFINHNFNTNNIAYLRLYFDLNVLCIDELPYVQILNNVLGKLDTKNYTVSQLQNKIKTYLGSLTFATSVMSKNKDSYSVKEAVTISSLEENIKHISVYFNEIVNNTLFDEEKIKTILVQLKNRSKNGIIENGVAAASTLVRSTLSKEGAISSVLSGVEMYDFLCELLEDFNFENLVEKLKEVMNKVFNKNNLIASVNGEECLIKKLKEEVYNLSLNDEEVEYQLQVSFKDEIGDGIIIPSGVNNNVLAINLKNLGETISGKLYVVQHILNYDYLWPEVRVKGGAYGSNFQIASSEDIVFTSYCDPSVKNTYDVYQNVSSYLENFEATEEEFISYLIGTIAKFDKPASNFAQILIADGNLFRENTKELREKIKEEILSTTIEDVRAYAKLFKKVAQLAKVFTIGNETKIYEYNRLENIKKLK